MLSRRGLLISGGSLAALSGLAYGLWPDLYKYDEELAYQRKVLASDPELRDFVRYATLAANGHNTQPWKFRIGENSVSILPDLTRRTEIVDPDDHHLFVSLGCATENLLISAQTYGRPGDVRVISDNDIAIEIALGVGAKQKTPLYDAIPLRQSTRSAFDGRSVPSADLEALESAAREDGVSVLLFTEPRYREAVLEFVVEGNSAQMNDAAFIAELRHWLRFSPEQAMASKDGLFSACSGHPALPGWLGNLAFDLAFKEKSENDKYRDHIRSSAGVAVFIGDEEGPEHWIRVGRSFQRFALQATALGIRNAHINQPIEVPAVRKEFVSWLGASDVRPDLVVRFGYAPPLPMSMRRSVDQVIV